MAVCLTPYTVRREKFNDTVPVPCGKCPNCVKNRISGWSFRLRQEAKKAISAFFVTLTYDVDHVNITPNGFMTLCKEDFQKFMKRFRKSHSKIENYDAKSIKYYCVGEYGGKLKRPHMHIILFNADLGVLIGSKYAKAVRRRLIDLNGHDPFICNDWPAGHITVGKVEDASIGYTLVYISKYHNIPEHDRDDRIPEFSLMSKGLGADYLTNAMVRYHHQDVRKFAHIVVEDGKKIPLPRYYKDKMYTDQDKAIIGHYFRTRAIEANDRYNSKIMTEYGVDEYSVESVKRSIAQRKFKEMRYKAKSLKNKSSL